MKRISEQLELSKLFVKEVFNTLSEEESSLLQKWKSTSENQKLYDSIFNGNSLQKRNEMIENIDIDQEWKKFLTSIESSEKTKKQKTNQHFQLNWYKWIASVAAVCILSLSGYFVYKNLYLDKVVPLAEIPIVPGKTQAVLVLSNGSVLNLDEKINKNINQNGAQISNNNGVLAYNYTGNADESQAINSLRIPKGGEYQLVLPDGSKVWLNSDTELNFPVSFNGNFRRVELSGEAYFEVAHNPQKPFIVVTQHQEIAVLGTSFNVSAYNDDKSTVTTLITGKVKVAIDGNDQNSYLVPGQQLTLQNETLTSSKENVDVNIYTAWKDGRFVLRDETLEQFMKKIARWYNVDILFNDNSAKNIKFTGDLPRYDNLNDILNILEMDKSVNIEIKPNKQILISKQN